MKTLAQTASFLLFFASQAHALSCLAPDAARAFQRVAQSDQTYFVVKGKFDFAARPTRLSDERPQTQSFAAKFTGQLLTSGGFTDDISDVLITINSNCVGQWCGEITPDTDYIAFIEQDGRKLTLQAEACPLNHFPEPDPKMVRQIEDCAAGKACEPQG